ncbi:MAG: NAD(P)-dependent oxidoreductase [Bdellovibrionales bacterium]
MNVVILENYSVNAVARLKAHDIDVSERTDDLSKADAVLIRSRTRINADFLEKAPNLKLIVSATSGFDHIDWRECRKRGIICAHTPEANAQSTAELTMALMLAGERDLPMAIRNVRGNQWRDGLHRPHGLDGKTLGIIGLGRVGSKVAKMAQTFGMKVIAHDPYINFENFSHLNTLRLGLIEVLKTSDVVSLHVPLTKETFHLINHATFKEMQAEAILINTSRGPVVDENDLMSALDEGMIRGAAMDVIEREPPPSGHRLLVHPRLLLTPHIGAFTESAWERASMTAVNQVLRLQKGERILDSLPLSAAWFEKT